MIDWIGSAVAVVLLLLEHSELVAALGRQVLILVALVGRSRVLRSSGLGYYYRPWPHLIYFAAVKFLSSFKLTLLTVIFMGPSCFFGVHLVRVFAFAF